MNAVARPRFALARAPPEEGQDSMAARVRAVAGGRTDGPYETLADLVARRQRRAKRPILP